MKVTREVIYGLLPGYFAGDVSDDTRALVEECPHGVPQPRLHPGGRLAALVRTAPPPLSLFACL